MVVMSRAFKLIVISALSVTNHALANKSQNNDLGETAMAVRDSDFVQMAAAAVNTVDGGHNDLTSLKKLMEEENLREQSEQHLSGRNRKRGRLKCLACHPGTTDAVCDGHNAFVCHDAVACFTVHVRDTEGVVTKSKGCAETRESASMLCSVLAHDGDEIHQQRGKSSQYAVDCCKSGDFCNNATAFPTLPDVPVLRPPPDGDSEEDSDTVSLGDVGRLALAVSLPVVVLVILASVILVIMRSCHNKRMRELNTKWGMSWLYGGGGGGTGGSDGDDEMRQTDQLLGVRAQVVGDSTLREFCGQDADDVDMTSGSGSGMPHLVQRTLAKQIDLLDRVGKGRYGEVWRGRWNGDSVAVKIFFSRDEDSWKRETDIYSTVLLRHENVLGYIGSDCTSQNSCTQLWLVTHFYENGSLYDYLNNVPLPGTVMVGSPEAAANKPSLFPWQAHNILLSSLNGLVHLHTEIFGTQGKPAIAHRDIKSKNILVRADGSCVIADFGLAVMHFQRTGKIDEHQNSRVGTKRYMSPEILDGTIEQNKTFESYKQADVYAFSLVIWEVLRRTRGAGPDLDTALDFALPYHQHVGPDPSFDEMKRVVSVDNVRPEVPQEWRAPANTYFVGMCRVMEECWHANPKVRLSTLRMRKSLTSMSPPGGASGGGGRNYSDYGSAASLGFGTTSSNTAASANRPAGGGGGPMPGLLHHQHNNYRRLVHVSPPNLEGRASSTLSSGYQSNTMSSSNIIPAPGSDQQPLVQGQTLNEQT